MVGTKYNEKEYDHYKATRNNHKKRQPKKNKRDKNVPGGNTIPIEVL